MHVRVGVGIAAAISIAALATTPAAGSERRERSRPADGALVELGRRLFFDPAASRAGMRSCADCHDPEHGYSDRARRSLDVRGATPNHSQTLIDVADSPGLHWHGEVETFAEVVRQRLLFQPGYVAGADFEPAGAGDVLDEFSSPGTAGIQARLRRARVDAFVSPSVSIGELPDPATTLRDAHRYDELFLAAFATRRVTLAHLVRALEAYGKTIRSGTSPYDRFVAGDARALPQAARRGLDHFRGAAGCADCHTMTGPRAPFTDHSLHESVTESPVASPEGGPTGSLLSRADRRRAEEDRRRRRSFKTPTLRDVARRGPYLHDGSAASLEDAVRRFLPPHVARDAAGRDDPRVVSDLVAFLHALTSDDRPGLASRVSRRRAKRTRLRFVDADGRPLCGFEARLLPAGDRLPGHGEPAPILRSTDADGWISFEPPLFTHVRIALEGGLRPAGGAFVPDTCRSADIRLPLRGRTRIAVTFPKGRELPELVARHPDAAFLPDREIPTTVLRPESTTGQPTSTTVVYGAWKRVDVPSEAVLDLPDPFDARDVFLRRDVATPIDLTPGR